MTSIGMINRRTIAAIALILMLVACTNEQPVRERVDFTAGWAFLLDDDSNASALDYDDSSWRRLNLPHDWAVEGDFSKDNPAGTGGGALPGGIGWYRKTFTVDKADAGKRLRIDFDGVYSNSEVFINGTSLGFRPYGFTSFSYDITPYLNYGGKNVVAVRVNNGEQPNCRWYSGSGIYRNVWLTKTNNVHIATNGVFFKADHVSDSKAILTVTTTLQIDGDLIVGDVAVKSVLLNSNGEEVASSVDVAENLSVNQTLEVTDPQLWGVDTPYLYKLHSEVIAEGKTVDLVETQVGIRTFNFDAETGFTLNGQPMKINGVCLHHDLGCLGAAINTRAIERQLEIMKEMGCNAIRTSHNPPAPELLDLCDRMGFIVQDEAFDMWRKKKTAYDYSRDFNEWHERDLRDMILRDRNHPSIIMWSIGNEVLEQWTHVAADTLSLEEANLLLNFGHSADMLAKDGVESVNSALTTKLADIVRDLDTTRPITAGCNEPDPGNHLFKSGALDIIGYNYHIVNVPDVPKNFPGMPFLFTESNSALMTRGYYRMPSDTMYIWPERWDKPWGGDPSFSCSSYENCHVPWGNSHEESLKLIRDNDFICGQFIWTGFDYLGEPTPYDWPARSSYFGIVDLAGFPKDVYYLYQSEWTDTPVLHLFPHWNWTEGEDIDLWCYYNNADSVELFVNGVSQGVRSKDKDNLHVVWRVKYEPGTIKVVALKDGQAVREQERHTAGEPYAIRLTPDRTTLKADGKDMSFVTVEVVDKDGNLCPNADNDIHFSVDGTAFIAGVDNGNPISMEHFKADHRKAFYGKCLVVLQNNGKKGTVKLQATADGLQSAESVLN